MNKVGVPNTVMVLLPLTVLAVSDCAAGAVPAVVIVVATLLLVAVAAEEMVNVVGLVMEVIVAPEGMFKLPVMTSPM
jgi:hypothetical protein